MVYRKEIDGLRALAVVSVIFYHAGFKFFSGGYIGVDIFFVISGYLITTILLEDIENQQFSFSNFYKRRAKRILPVLYLVVIITSTASIFILYPAELISFAKSVISIPFFSSNFFFWSERGYFNSDSLLKPLIHTWSLAVEEQFYIFFPIFLFFLRNKISLFYILLVLSFFISLGLSYYLTLLHFETAFYLIFARAYEIILGSFAAILLKKNKFVIQKSIYADFFSAAGLSFIIFSIINFDSKTLFPYVNSLFPTFGSFLFIIFSQHSFLIKKIFSTKGLVFLGLISYSLYLWHQPIFALAKKLNKFNDNTLLLISLSLALSYFSYRYIEKPFKKKNFSNKKILFFSVSGSLILILIGIIIITKDGLSNRYPQEDRKILSQLESYKKYNQKNFDNLKFKNFKSDADYKVLLLGDSYAKDFLNIIIESNQFKNVSFSTRQINGECGNLYLKNYDILKDYIPKNRLSRCLVMGRYEGNKFRKIVKSSDEIWLVSNWPHWTINFLPKSIENMEKDFQKRIRIFGIKNFGKIDLYELLKIPNNQRKNFSLPLSQEAINRSKQIDQKMDYYDYYYSILEPLCGGNKFNCKIFTHDNYLISPDGGHLSRKGAIESSFRLKNIFNEIIYSMNY